MNPLHDRGRVQQWAHDQRIHWSYHMAQKLPASGTLEYPLKSAVEELASGLDVISQDAAYVLWTNHDLGGAIFP